MNLLTIVLLLAILYGSPHALGDKKILGVMLSFLPNPIAPPLLVSLAMAVRLTALWLLPPIVVVKLAHLLLDSANKRLRS